MDIRLCDVVVGDVVQIISTRYRVVEIKERIVLKRCNIGTLVKYRISSNDMMTYGAKCQMWVKMIHKIDSEPELIKDLKYKEGFAKTEYTNISGHLKTIEKYSK